MILCYYLVLCYHLSLLLLLVIIALLTVPSHTTCILPLVSCKYMATKLARMVKSGGDRSKLVLITPAGMKIDLSKLSKKVAEYLVYRRNPFLHLLIYVCVSIEKNIYPLRNLVPIQRIGLPYDTISLQHNTFPAVLAILDCYYCQMIHATVWRFWGPCDFVSFFHN